MPMGRSAAMAAGVVVVGLAVIIGFSLTQPVELPSRLVASVPQLLSEPAGALGGDLVLEPDGLGIVAFGESEAAAMATLTESLGTPVEDAPQPCDSETDLVRWVRWGNLSAAFPDGQFGGYVIGVYVPPDSPELRIETADGASLRDSVDELTAVYGNRLAWTGQEETGFSEPIDAFGIDGFDIDNPTPTGMGGYVEGGREDGHVITFFAGQPCGPR